MPQSIDHCFCQPALQTMSKYQWHVARLNDNTPANMAFQLHINVSPIFTQPTSWPHVASPTWSSTEQVARPATSDWRALEACCRPWTWWCGYATMINGKTESAQLNKTATTQCWIQLTVCHLVGQQSRYWPLWAQRHPIASHVNMLRPQ